MDRGAEQHRGHMALAERPLPADLRRALARMARFNLFVAFAFTVMADPVSSVAYAIEAALDALHGGRSQLVLTMSLVLGAIALVSAGYHRLIARFPNGGGGAEALAAAFGEGWAFLPLGALLVDFTLTIAVSCAAAASALIAQAPELADLRVPLAAGLVGVVALGSLLGHRGRVVFATATLLFVGIAAVVIIRGALAPATPGPRPSGGDAGLGVALLAMPLGMALATGVEAPSNAIAQLGQLDSDARRRFGQLTIWVMLGIVGALTLALAALTTRFGLGLPATDSTLMADVARRATAGDGWFDVFQIASALLLLAAAASSFLAGSGLLKALALHGADGHAGLLPRRFGHINRAYAPAWGIALLFALATALVVVAGGHEQTLVHFYAVAVFASFLGALVAGSRLSWSDGRHAIAAMDAGAALVVALVLALNLRRGDPLASLAVAGFVSLGFWRAWVRRGRPSGIATLARG